MGKKYRIINDIIDERESVRMVNTVPFIHRPDHMALKVSDVSAAYWQHLTHNKTLQFYICTVMAFLSREILPVCI